MGEVRVLLVDDHPVVRAGLRAMLTGFEGISIAAEASDGRAALKELARMMALDEAPDVVLMDLQMGEGMDGVTATAAIRKLQAPPPVLILTTYDTDADILAAVEAGASGYMLKDAPPEQLRQAVLQAAAGGTVLAPRAAALLMDRISNPGTSLTPREVQLLELLATGLSNRAIAKQVFISEATVKTHLVHIYGKLGVDNRTAAIAAATQRRIIRPPGARADLGGSGTAGPRRRAVQYVYSTGFQVPLIKPVPLFEGERMSRPVPAVDALLATYGAPDACAAELLCDAHDPSAVAFTVVAADLSAEDITYGQLRERSERGAAALAELGIGPGDAVATLMGKSADLVVMLLAIWRRGAVHVPLFTAFAWPAIELRLTASGAKAVITDADQRAKIQETSAAVVVAGAEASQPDLALTPLLARQEPGIASEAVGGGGALVLIFTSGTTGSPKGVPVPVRALAAFRQYVELGLDVSEEDVFWNAADPGWAYGLYYGILGPMAAGRRNLLLRPGFSPELSFKVLEAFSVTNFAAAPTVYRTMRAKTGDGTGPFQLRRASSAGEPLTPEVISWAREVLGVPVRDHYGQTEHGMMIINAWHDDVRTELRPGSMGRPLPGWSCAVLKDNADEPAAPGELGRVAVNVAGSPMMWFTGYQDAPEKTAERFSADGKWYLTGDAGMVDADGYYFFSSRDDDVIIMAGYRIGPFDVESVLATHPAVLETAVVGAPDELRGEVLEAYVVLADRTTGSDSLVAELQAMVKTQFAAHAYPRRIHFVETLPKTPSGKLQRYILRQQRAAESGR